MRRILFTLIFLISLFPVFAQETVSSLYNDVVSAYNSGFLPGCVDKASSLENQYPESVFLPKVLLKKGECYVRMGQAKNAVEALEKVIPQLYIGNKDLAESYYWKGRAHYLLGQGKEAEYAFKKCCSALTGADGKKYYNSSVMYLGRICYDRKDYKGAVPDFEYVVGNGKSFDQKDYNEAVQKLAQCYNRSGNFEKTIQLEEKIRKLAETETGKDFNRKILEVLSEKKLEAEISLGKKPVPVENKNYLALEKARRLMEGGTENFEKPSAGLIQNAKETEVILSDIQIQDDIKNFRASFEETKIKTDLTLKKYDDVISAYEKMENPSDGIRYMAALSYYAEKKFEEACKVLEETENKNRESQRVLAASYFKLGRFSEAGTIYKEISENGNYALCLYRQKKYGEAYSAASILQDARSIWIASSSAFALKDYKAASAGYAKLSGSKELSEKTKSEAAFYKGVSDYMLSDYDAALKALDAYLATSENRFRSESLYYKTRSCLMQQNFAEAETNCRKYLETISDKNKKLQTSLLLASILAMGGKADASSDEYYKAYRNLPESDRKEYALYRSAEVYYSANDYEKAAKKYEEYSKNYQNGSYADAALYHQFSSYARMKDYKKAYRSGKEYVQAFPESMFTNEVLNLLVKISYSEERYADAYSEALKLKSRLEYKDRELEKIISVCEKIQKGESVEMVKAVSAYEEAGGKNTPEGRKLGTELAELYNRNDETRRQSVKLAEELLAGQKKNIQEEHAEAARNALLLAEYFYSEENKTQAAENYLLAAEYFRMENNGDKAALCLYTAAECFVHLEKPADARETAKLLEKLYPESRYANAVWKIVK